MLLSSDGEQIWGIFGGGGGYVGLQRERNKFVSRNQDFLKYQFDQQSHQLVTVARSHQVCSPKKIRLNKKQLVFLFCSGVDSVEQKR